MPPLYFSFAPRTPRRRIFGWLLLLSGILSAVWAGLHMDTLLTQRKVLAWQLASYSAEADAPAPLAADVIAERTQLQALRGTIQASWQPVFSALERCASPHVALLSIRVISRTGSLQIEGKSRSLKDALDYLQALQKQSIFRNVLLQQNKSQEDVDGQPVTFNIRAEIVS